MRKRVLPCVSVPLCWLHQPLPMEHLWLLQERARFRPPIQTNRHVDPQHSTQPGAWVWQLSSKQAGKEWHPLPYNECLTWEKFKLFLVSLFSSARTLSIVKLYTTPRNVSFLFCCLLMKDPSPLHTWWGKIKATKWQKKKSAMIKILSPFQDLVWTTWASELNENINVAEGICMRWVEAYHGFNLRLPLVLYLLTRLIENKVWVSVTRYTQSWQSSDIAQNDTFGVLWVTWM